MGVIHRVFALVGFLILVVVAVGAYLYFTDYGAGATVTQKGTSGSDHYVVTTTKLFGYDVRKVLPVDEWSALCVGNFVIYHVQSAHTLIYDHEGGKLIYDSAKGLMVPVGSVTCAA